jgi:molybdate transport system substrate-binding protein
VILRLAAAFLLLSATVAKAETANIAVAANFAGAAKVLAADFAAVTDHEAFLSFGSTGQFYVQIQQGAPYNAFLAADQVRPELLEKDGVANPGSRFTYAVGRLALFSRDPNRRLDADALRTGDFDRIAIANPKTAPYGAAAMLTLARLGASKDLSGKIVRGKNVAQAYQFAWTGAAEVGLIAASQISHHQDGARWIVPQALHQAIAQDAVQLSPDHAAASAFLKYLRSDQAKATIRRFGYGLVE